MYKAIFLPKYNFIAFLIALCVVNARLSFAAAQHDVVDTDDKQDGGDNRPDGGLNIRNNAPKNPAGKEVDYDNLADNAEVFSMLQKKHPVPDNLDLVKEKETVMIVGCMDTGKSTLTNGLAGVPLICKMNGYIDVDEKECKYDEDEADNNVRQQPIQSTIARNKGRKSYTKMPNIFLDKHTTWALVDCPGFDDKSKMQSLFIKASVKMVVRNIKKLRAVLCVMDKKAFVKDMQTLDDVQKHMLSKLVVYLHDLLENPLQLCRGNLLLVINKTGGEYRLSDTMKKLAVHRKHLEAIQAHYEKQDEDYKDGKLQARKSPMNEWYEDGQPVLDFIYAVEHKDRAICMQNMTSKEDFDIALRKIGRVNKIVCSGKIKKLLPKEDQERVLSYVLKNNPRLMAVQHAYDKCEKEAQEKYRESEEKYKYDCFPRFRNSGLILTALIIVLSIGIVMNNPKHLVSVIDKVGVGIIRGCKLSVPVWLTVAFLAVFFKGDAPQAPTVAAIKACTALTQAGQDVVGVHPLQEKSYYELFKLGDILEQHPVLQIYREAYEKRYAT